MFVWLDTVVLPGQTVIAIANASDEMLGIMQSRLHGLWAKHLSTRLETRPRYTPTSCFDTFPFPFLDDSQKRAIAGSAKALDNLRQKWLNPPEWTTEEVLEFAGSAEGHWHRYIHGAGSNRIGTVRYPRLVPKNANAANELKSRTLTNLYNEPPTWLDLAHKELDAAVFDAYGWPANMSDDELLANLLKLNLERAKEQK